MPTYEYACDSCGNDFDIFQKMSEDPLKICPKCGKVIHRVLSAGIGISFQGKGFYVNDSHSSGVGGTNPGCSCNGKCSCGKS